MSEIKRFPPSRTLCEYCGHVIGPMDARAINVPRMAKLNPMFLLSTEVDLSPTPMLLDRYHSWCWEAKRQGRPYDEREWGPA